ncbi:dynein regulation protein LC7 [Streptacidiphilus sp. 4-A2]|nr:dynein regulation protein LC7 [Streptacidiphilus sp. 4-A2]
MTTASAASPQSLVDELRSLRERVMGLSESAVSTADGLLVVADTATTQPESLAALSAAALGLGKRTAHEVGIGRIRDVTTHCSSGYCVVLAIGEQALLVILGDEGMDLAALHSEAPATVRRLAALLQVPVPA